MRHVSYKLKIAIKDAAGLGSISIFRWVEQHLSPRAFFSLLRPFFLVRAAFEQCLQKNETRPRLARFFVHAKNDQDANTATHGYLLE
jgi:hypothetical protein